MVLEGVHLVPGMVSLPVVDALVVHVVIAIENEDVHSQHFVLRQADSGGARGVTKYLDHLGDIRVIQDFIVDEARKIGAPVIENRSMEEAVGAVIELVLDRAAQLQGVA